MRKQVTGPFWVFAMIVLFTALVLLGRVGYIQLFDDTFKDRSRTYAIEKQLIYPSRGLIHDREGRLLVHNEGSYDLMVTHALLGPRMDTLRLCRLLGIDLATFEENITRDWKDIRYSRHIPFVFLSKVSPEVFTRTREMLFEFPGFFFQARNVRIYPYPHAAHVLGYLGEVSREQVEASEGTYLPGDYIGIAGLEKSFEAPLRGEHGVRYLLKDNVGRVVGSWLNGRQDREPVSGKDIQSTIDIELTRYIESLLQNKRGAVVAIEPSTGEILAMVSSPAYDPNLLTISKARGQAFRQLQADTLKPFFDRSIMARYPPGSIFKAVVGLIALEEGLTHPRRAIPCYGAYFYNEESWGCHAHWPCHNIQAALTVSCNTYFFTLVRDILDKYGVLNVRQGLDLFNRYLEAFGLGHTLGVEMPNEKGGFLPTPAFYDNLYKKRRWLSPTIMNIGIGQGEVQLTTLQMAHLAAIIANRGSFHNPHLVKRYLDDGLTIDTQYTAPRRVPVEEKHFQPIVDGLEQVVLYGTARSSYIPGIPLCGKTGTSQNPHGKDHSVFFGFAPKSAPKIAIAVYIENAGYGGDFAAPIASLIIEKYLRGEILPERLYLEEKMIRTNVNALP
jgi:penicillin-binding protein 2